MKWSKNKRLATVMVILFLLGLGILLCFVFALKDILQKSTQADEIPSDVLYEAVKRIEEANKKVAGEILPPELNEADKEVF